MKPWCKELGLTEQGARCAEDALPLLMTALELVGKDAIRSVLREAEFRIFELPKLVPSFQRDYARKNGFEPTQRTEEPK